MRVIELIPGMKIVDPSQHTSHTYVAQCPHPLYKGLQLVIWRLSTGRWSHDALSAQQDVGNPDVTALDYEANLRNAFGRAEMPKELTGLVLNCRNLAFHEAHDWYRRTPFGPLLANGNRKAKEELMHCPGLGK